MRSSLELALSRKMSGPQRHRLLQGYPVPALMVPFDPFDGGMDPLEPLPGRELLVGILPHASCNPGVQGCGYCTFPHEEFRGPEVRATVRAVIGEIEMSATKGRAVEAVYLGGGTANLTPADVFAELCGALAANFDLSGAEVTLEGAPAYFTNRKEALLETLEALACRSRRLSMGVQSFNPDRIALMGRENMGMPHHVQRAVETARRRDMTTSADLMINQPGQTLAEMKDDVRRASDLGFSQICLYHLVLFRGLDIPWARDKDLLASLPDNETACANWREVRELALSLGYQQRSLTNFEREGEFGYEDCSYRPERYDWAGFGPEALSCFTDPGQPAAVKWMNQPNAADYRRAVGAYDARCRAFYYGPEDLRLLYLTRSLARLRVSRAVYKECYGTDMLADHTEPFEVLAQAELVDWDATELWLTPRGMFFADSVVGLLAARRVAALRGGARDEMESSLHFRMG